MSNVNADILLIENFSRPDSSAASQLLAHQHIELATGRGPAGGDAIRVAYVGFDMGSERVCVDIPLSRKVTHAKISYEVCFPANFQWVGGGKIPGLGPDKHVAGGRERRPDGWSARNMFGENGRILNYLYDQDHDKKWGFGGTTEQSVLSLGPWQHIELEMQLNAPDQANGWACTRVNGQEVMRTENVEFRGEGGDETLISNLLFHTFHGGNQPENAPKDDAGNYVTVHAYFTNLLVTAEEG